MQILEIESDYLEPKCKFRKSIFLLGPKCKFPESTFCYWCQNIWEVNGRGGDGWILVAVQLGGVGKSGWLLPSTGSCCESSFHSSHGGRISHVMAEALLTSNKSTLGRLPPGASTPSGITHLAGGTGNGALPVTHPWRRGQLEDQESWDGVCPVGSC